MTNEDNQAGVTYPLKFHVNDQRHARAGMFAQTAIYMVFLNDEGKFLQGYDPESGNCSFTDNIATARRYSLKQIQDMQAGWDPENNMFNIHNVTFVLAPEFNGAIAECSSVVNDSTRAIESMLTQVMWLLREINQEKIDTGALWQAMLDAEKAQRSAVNLFSSVAMKTIKRLQEDEKTTE